MVLPVLPLLLSACVAGGPTAIGAPPTPSPERVPSVAVLDVEVGRATVRRRFDLERVLFPDPDEAEPPEACARAGDSTAQIRCLFEARYHGDPQALALALDLFDETGSAAGVEEEQDFDGHYRGIVHLVPELPVGPERHHLVWVADGLRQDALVLEAVAAIAPRPVAFRQEALELRFFRSVGRRTPSAIASGWTVSYNLSGSLNTGATSVRDTLFHEVFHLNDYDHADWSRRALTDLFDGLVAQCGTDPDCLAPFAPGTTRVRGGTWYAFQPNNGVVVREYAAELALRWAREQRAVLRGEVVRAPFKCATPENAEAWEALTQEFFGGGDLVPPCS